jgi:hypothetical protein
MALIVESFISSLLGAAAGYLTLALVAGWRP